MSILDNLFGNSEMWRALRGGKWWYACFYKKRGHYYKWVNNHDKVQVFRAVERYDD